MPSVAPRQTLTPDELDDLIYFARTGDLPSLKATISQLCTDSSSSASAQGNAEWTPSSLLKEAIDVDSDGLGSQCSLLHYPAANGNIEVVTYLLDLLREGSASQQQQQHQIINHKNVSGNTPLHWAGMNGHLPVVQALVGAGADPGLRNAAGRDAAVEAEMSAKDGSKECAQWMWKNCASLERSVEGGDARESEEEEAAEEQKEAETEVQGQGANTNGDNENRPEENSVTMQDV